MISVLVLGQSGQLGQCVLSNILSNKMEWQSLSRRDLDLSKPETIKPFFKNHGPVDCLVNLAAYTLVDKAESEKSLAQNVNAKSSAELASICTSYFYISTDYVFSGEKKTPYLETDQPSPISAYGESKLLGEKWAQEVNKNTFIVRTSWLYSEYGQNFVKKMLELAQTRKEIRVVNDQLGSPTYAQDLAMTLIQLVKARASVPSGIYNYCNSGVCSWYELAKKIFEIKKTGTQVIPIPTTDYPTPARRPAYSVLDTAKMSAALKITLPNWESSLQKCLFRL